MSSLHHKYRFSNPPLKPDHFLLLLFFFFNIFLLPSGLLYTTLLTPFFLHVLWNRRRLKALMRYLLISLPLAAYHLFQGADPGAYLKSYALFSSAFIFITWAYYFLKERLEQLPGYFSTLTIYNFFLSLLAILMLFIPVLNQQFWYFEPIHPAIPVIPRLKLLVYEPSFYSLQLAPIFIYYLLAYLFEERRTYLLSLLLLSFSLILSLSFGVLGGLLIAVLTVFVTHFFSLMRRRKIFYHAVYISVFTGIIVYVLLQSELYNPIFERIDRILEGDDTSANGRTWEAFLLAWRILGETDYILGAGLGQIKVAGHEVIVNYYNYVGKWADLVRIPNAMAETLASFGLLGAFSRVFIQIGLFFYTQAYKNYYRLFLFVFIFVYQFTGSYLTNIYEYLIWLLVFLPVFPQFDKNNQRGEQSGLMSRP